MSFALVAGACLLSVIVVLSPILMTYRLVNAGGRLTQKYMRNRPEFSDIVRVHRFSFRARPESSGADSPSSLRCRLCASRGR